MKTGKIVEVHRPYNFGFIRSDDAEEDYYYHATALANGAEFEDLKPGDHVQFEVVETKKGSRAVKVGKVEKTNG